MNPATSSLSPSNPRDRMIPFREDRTARYYQVMEEDFSGIITDFKDAGCNLLCILATEDLIRDGDTCLLYVLEDENEPQFTVLIRTTDTPVSVARIFSCAILFEREISDGFGISFLNSYDQRRLFLHEAYPEDFHPLRHSFINHSIIPRLNPDPYIFREIEGSSVYQIPVGPVHAGIIEPGHFRFSVIGEAIVNLEIRLGYLHRGIEKCAEGKEPAEAIRVAESISGDESVANACGFCLAVEQIAQADLSERAEYIRGILLELERSYSLISDLAGMLTDVAHAVTASQLIMLRELLQREADGLTGSRFMKGWITIGGVRDDIPQAALDSLFKTAGYIERELQKIAEKALSVPTVLDRFSTTGVIPPELIAPLALSGPVARACGSGADTRIDHPYGIYREKPPTLVCESGGDVLARFTQKYQEVVACVRYIQELIIFLPDGVFSGSLNISDGFALAATESARGMNLHFVQIKNGRIHRYKARTASFCNWYAIEHAVIGDIVADFPVINKSLNLSYSGTDL